jgi:hypothetical protein
MKLHQINCLFAKNVMNPNKIVYKARWECVSFLSRALVRLGYALVNYLKRRFHGGFTSVARSASLTLEESSSFSWWLATSKQPR